MSQSSALEQADLYSRPESRAPLESTAGVGGRDLEVTTVLPFMLMWACVCDPSSQLLWAEICFEGWGSSLFVQQILRG